MAVSNGGSYGKGKPFNIKPCGTCGLRRDGLGLSYCVYGVEVEALPSKRYTQKEAKKMCSLYSHVPYRI